MERSGAQLVEIGGQPPDLARLPAAAHATLIPTRAAVGGGAHRACCESRA